MQNANARGNLLEARQCSFSFVAPSCQRHGNLSGGKEYLAISLCSCCGFISRLKNGILGNWRRVLDAYDDLCYQGTNLCRDLMENNGIKLWRRI